MSLTELLWLATAAYGLHIVEEFTFDWRNWANNVLGLPVDWPQFYLVNALVIVLGVVAAEHCLEPLRISGILNVIAIEF